jgi:hypothetical protein
MKKALFRVSFDKKRDVLNVLRGDNATLNLPVNKHQSVRINPDTLEIVGYVIINFSKQYPKLIGHLNSKERWFVRDFFGQRLKDWNALLSPLKSKKALIDYLAKEYSNSESAVTSNR